MVVDAEVEDAVDGGLLIALAGDDDESRRLPAAPVAAAASAASSAASSRSASGPDIASNASRIAGQTSGERSMLPCTLTSASLRWPAWGIALRSGMRRGGAARVHECHLPHLATLVCREQLVERLPGAPPLGREGRAREARSGAR